MPFARARLHRAQLAPRGIELALKRSVQGKMRGHCVLCGASVGLEQLVVHVRSFRPDHPTNIVLLTETEPTPLVWEQIALEGVFVIKGSPLSRMDLQRAACQDASMVVVLADSATIDPVAEGALAACARCLDVCFTP